METVSAITLPQVQHKTVPTLSGSAVEGKADTADKICGCIVRYNQNVNKAVNSME